MLQENLVDFNPFRGILSVSRESDRSNIHVERTVLGSKIWWPYNRPLAICIGSCQI